MILISKNCVTVLRAWILKGRARARGRALQGRGVSRCAPYCGADGGGAGGGPPGRSLRSRRPAASASSRLASAPAQCPSTASLLVQLRL